MTASTLTASDRAALEFYQSRAAYVEGFGLSNLDRPERLLFKKGRKLIEAALASAKAPTRETYADAEVRFMVRTYLNNGADMEATRAAYFEFYPNNSHSASSVWMKISRIRTLDTQFTGDTAWQTDQQVEGICRAEDPDRFGF